MATKRPTIKRKPARVSSDPIASIALVGRRITKTYYMSSLDAEGMGWWKRALVIVLGDGTSVFPSADDEGNDAGALFGQTRGGGGVPLTFPALPR